MVQKVDGVRVGNGAIALTAEVLIKLSNFYGVSIDYLLDQTNDPKKK